jgi:hypothetical protein
MYSLESTKREGDRSRMQVLEDEPMEDAEEGTDGVEEARKYGFY